MLRLTCTNNGSWVNNVKSTFFTEQEQKRSIVKFWTRDRREG